MEYGEGNMYVILTYPVITVNMVSFIFLFFLFFPNSATLNSGKDLITSKFKILALSNQRIQDKSVRQD